MHIYTHTWCTDMKLQIWSNRRKEKTYFSTNTIAKNRFVRWTRPPEEGERTDNEDQDEEEEIPEEERRQVEPSSRRDWIMGNNKSS